MSYTKAIRIGPLTAVMSSVPSAVVLVRTVTVVRVRGTAVSTSAIALSATTVVGAGLCQVRPDEEVLVPLRPPRPAVGLGRPNLRGVTWVKKKTGDGLSWGHRCTRLAGTATRRYAERNDTCREIARQSKR